MSDHAFNAICSFENAREIMDVGDIFPRIQIGRIGGIDGWGLELTSEIDENDLLCYEPFIFTIGERPTVRCCYYFNILKNDGSSAHPDDGSIYLSSLYGIPGVQLSTDDWMDEENGYLKNGTIRIEYGFQIEGILSPNNIWTFNFHDRLFDCQEKMNMVYFYTSSEYQDFKVFHCHKQLLTYHSTYFDSDSIGNRMIELTNENLGSFEIFLQISHGVKVKIDDSTATEILDSARKYGLSNVIQLVDQALDSEMTISKAIEFGLNRRLAQLLREVKTLNGLTEELKKMDLDAMSGEMMKKSVMFFLELDD
uniref:BTB domain-containing protein n=1 Tax=Caenorhabditis tropicalis TaxID=1561998 RepID=A0A1I7UKT8_9PELO